MVSELIITSVGQLQKKINTIMKKNNNNPCIYISLNKTQKSTELLFEKDKIDISKIFFIDCVTTEKSRDDVLHIAPEKLELLSAAIQEFIKDIKGRKTLIIDAISTLLIYNNENKVAQFVKTITEQGDANDLEIIAFSPMTKGEELLNKIFNFFDKVTGVKK